MIITKDNYQFYNPTNMVLSHTIAKDKLAGKDARKTRITDKYIIEITRKSEYDWFVVYKDFYGNQKYSFDAGDRVTGVLVTKSQNLVIHEEKGTHPQKVKVYTPSGDVIWEHTFGYGINDMALAPNDSKLFVLTDGSGDDFDGELMEFDMSDGHKNWTRGFGDEMHSLICGKNKIIAVNSDVFTNGEKMAITFPSVFGPWCTAMAYILIFCGA